MSTLPAVEEIAKSAHKRLDKIDDEILKLRQRSHDHAGILQNHTGIIFGMSQSVSELTTNVNKLTATINRATWVTVGGVGVGVALLTGMLYIVEKLLEFL